MSSKNNRKYFLCISAFSVLALFLHMSALKLIYKSIDLLLQANGASHQIQQNLAQQVDSLKRYSNYCTNSFFIISYLFLVFIGIMLITRKIKLKIYVSGYLIFEIVQAAGLPLFISIFNRYELTEGFGRLRLIHRHELFWAMLIIPVIIYAGYGLLRKVTHSSG